MTIKAKKLIAMAVVVGCLLLNFVLSDEMFTNADIVATNTGVGSVETLLARYDEWEATYERTGGDRNLIVAMGWFKGLSTEHHRANGVVKLDLVDGSVSVEIKGLPEDGAWDLWLVDNEPGRSIMPEPGDAMTNIGALTRKRGVAVLQATLGNRFFENFEPDFVFLTRSGKPPTESRVLIGSTDIFYKLHRSGEKGRFGLINTDPPRNSLAHGSLISRIVAFLAPKANAQIGPIPNPSTPLEHLISKGRKVFFTETFAGNGRTCGTCHREDNNLTIDPEYIAKLPSNDPLFVAEYNPELAKNFEEPALMRKLGLIRINPDGFEDLSNKYVMRGVSHILAELQTALKPSLRDRFTVPKALRTEEHKQVTPPMERTGWGGDGAAGTGTLREFAIGGVAQHLTRTLNRIPGVDFRLPTEEEMDALEAFQKSAGRREDLDLKALKLKSEIAARGQEIFLNAGKILDSPFEKGNNTSAGKCFICHFNAGAGDFVDSSVNKEPVMRNGSFDTGVEDFATTPARLISGQTMPRDGGFGRLRNALGAYGDGRFNTPPVVEAADTAPYFHNNSVQTLDGAVAFYSSPLFNDSTIGKQIGGIHLETTENEAVTAFLRVINALENIRSSSDLERRAKIAVDKSQVQELIKLSISEIEDAIEVLHAGFLHPDARAKLNEALTIENDALKIGSASRRKASLDKSSALKAGAREIMVY